MNEQPPQQAPPRPQQNPLQPMVMISAETMHAIFKVLKHFPQNKANKDRLKIENQKTPKIEHFIEVDALELAKQQFE